MNNSNYPNNQNYRPCPNTKTVSKIIVALCLFFLCISPTYAGYQMMYELKGSWKFRQLNSKDWMDAKVPGCVHTDLIWNKRIEDPFYRNNEKYMQWIDTVDWEYQLSFVAKDEILNKEQVELVFNGLDTYAEIYLNNILLSATNNMFRTWTIDCKKAIKTGDNILRIVFHAAAREGLKEIAGFNFQFPLSGGRYDNRASILTRKSAMQYGWDMAPRFLGCGIWRQPYIRGYNNAKITDTWYKPISVSAQKATYEAITEVYALKAGEYNYTVYLGDAPRPMVEKKVKLVPGLNTLSIELSIDKPTLWWPNGMGDHFMYLFRTRLLEKENIVDEMDRQIGVRTIKLVQKPDAQGSSFYFEINGKPLYIKGSNWMPADAFISRVNHDKYNALLNTVVLSNMNMLRIWGGGTYEDQYFYDLCASKGILIWQDFMFANTMYPSPQPFLDNIKAEAEEVIKRLRNNPALALWCGNSEIDQSWFSGKWDRPGKYSAADSLALAQSHTKIFGELLPKLIETMNSEIAYRSSSPMSENAGLQQFTSGDVHDMSPWQGRSPLFSYTANIPRFSSRFGFQAFPDKFTVDKFTNSEDLSLNSSIITYRQKCIMPWVRESNVNKYLDKQISLRYRESTSFENTLYLSQLLQMEVMKSAIEAQRRSFPYCMGTLTGQFNDVYPAISYATVDYYNRWKAAHYAVKKSFADIILSPVTDSTTVKVYAVSDKAEATQATLQIRVYDFNGKVLFKEDKPLTIDAGSKVYYEKAEKELLGKGKKNAVVLNVRLVSGETEISENNLYFVPPALLALQPVKVKYEIEKVKGGYNITLNSKVLAKNLYLSTDNANGFFSDNYFDLLPGQTVQVKYTGDELLTLLESTFKTMSLFDSY